MVRIRFFALALVVGCSNSVITTAPAGSVDELGSLGGSGGEAYETEPEASGGATEAAVTSKAPAGGSQTESSTRVTSAVAAGGTSAARSATSSATSTGGRSTSSLAAQGGSSAAGVTLVTQAGGTSVATTSTAPKFPEDCPRDGKICEIFVGADGKQTEICKTTTCNDAFDSRCTQSGECVSCPTSPYGGNTHLNCDGDHSNGCEYYVGDKEYVTGQQVCPVIPS